MKLADIPIDLIFYIFSLLGAVAAFFFKGLGSVQEGEQAVKCRWGRALKKKNGEFDVRDPGLVLLIPFMETISKRHVREQTLNLVNQNVTLADGFIQVVSAVVQFRVVDIYKALFAVENLIQSLENVALKIIQEELSRKTYTELSKEAIGIDDGGRLSPNAAKRLGEIAARWGVEILEFGLTDNSILAEQAYLISMQAGAQMKIKALEDLAEKLELEKIGDLDSGFAAAFIGTPLVSTIATNRNLSFEMTESGKDGEDGDNKMSAPIKALGALITGMGKRTIS